MFFYYLFCVCVFVVNAKNIDKKDDFYRLDIVHYNDFHDRFEETSVALPICITNDSLCIGGFSRLYNEIQVLLQERPETLVLDAGDTYHGTYWYHLLKWNITEKFINMIPQDAHAIGNHEFDDGVAGLAPYLKALKAPVVAANLISSKESELYGTYKPHVIIEKNGRKIGVIGLITPKTQKILGKTEELTFLEPIPVIREEAKALSDMGVDIIVVLSHCGFKDDIDIAKEAGENVDIIVGAHSHTLLWNGEAPSKERVEGPYPVIVESEAKPGHKVLIVTASAFSKYLGNISIFFDDKGDLDHYEGTPIFLNRSIPEDPVITALLQPYKEKLHSMVDEVIGFTEHELKGEDCSLGECTLGDLIADALLDAANEKYPTDLPHISFIIRNTIRASMPKGDITRGGLINMSPFTSKVGTLVVPGRYILEAFEVSFQSPWVVKPYAGPYTPMVAGMKLKVNTTSAQVLEALVLVNGKMEALDPDKDYQLTTYTFLVSNMYENLEKYGRDLKLIGTDIEVIERYIKKISPINKYGLDNRLTLIS